MVVANTSSTVAVTWLGWACCSRRTAVANVVGSMLARMHTSRAFVPHTAERGQPFVVVLAAGLALPLQLDVPATDAVGILGLLLGLFLGLQLVDHPPQLLLGRHEWLRSRGRRCRGVIEEPRWLGPRVDVALAFSQFGDGDRRQVLAIGYCRLAAGACQAAVAGVWRRSGSTA